jgi:hypothetical protein
MVILLLALLQAPPCVPDCPTSKAHIESVSHTAGKACPSCAGRIDVCFELCAGCALKKGLCRGCGGKALQPARVWTPSSTGEPGIRLLHEGVPDVDFSKGPVIAITRGTVLASEKARLEGVREFADRVIVTFSSRAAQCGTEPRVSDALYVQVPRTPGKKVIVQHVRHSIPLGEKLSTVAEFAARE